MVCFQDISRVSQQRDCPGFSPDSLLIRIVEMSIRNQFGAKIVDFIIQWGRNEEKRYG